MKLVNNLIGDTLFNDLNHKEKANAKSKEIAKLKIAKYKKNNLDIEIIGDIEAIEGGIQLFAKAWKDGEQLGFGKDGTIDIERFLIYNPPILVDDDNGDIISEFTDEDGVVKQRKLKEDPEEAIRQSLEHIIKIIGKEGSNIVTGKVGNTTSTFYPDTGTGATTVDGRVDNNTGGTETWAQIHDATSGTSATDAATLGQFAEIQTLTTTDRWRKIVRSFFLFDTSSLPDGDTINSATFSLYVTAVSDEFDQSFCVNSTSPAANNDLVTDDFDQVGTTAFSSPVAVSSISTSAYTDFLLNASGLSNISKTGISKFGSRMSSDRLDIEPTWESNKDAYTFGAYADQTGTANDPKLVIEHGTTGNVLDAETGVFALTGNTATFQRALIMDAGTGSFILTGNDITFQRGYVLDCETGVFTLTGNDVILETSAVSLDAETGVFELVGNDIGFKRSLILECETGEFILTGNDAVISVCCFLDAETGVFELTGNDIEFRGPFRLNAETGVFTLTGNDINFTSPIRWTNEPKSTSTWGNESKNTSIWTNESKS